jgi:GTP-binding protein HflX
VVTQRETTRRERKRAEVPTIALVGYTNAGKSTLFNTLTGAEAFAANQLFATLDPTVRRLDLPDARHVLLADTVGFVRDLPHELVAAFRSTLQEARESMLLLHVIDAADPHRSERIAQVNQVLEEVGASDLPQIEVFNKVDLLGEEPRVDLDQADGEERVRRVWLSAETGVGLPLLIDAIGRFIGPELVHRHVVLQPQDGRARARFFAAGAVVNERTLPGGETDLEVSMPKRAFEHLCRNEGIDCESEQLRH